MEGIQCKSVPYDKYAKITKEIQTKLCFGEAESCIESMVNQQGGGEEDSAEPAAVGGEENIAKEETKPEEGEEPAAASFLQLQLKARAKQAAPTKDAAASEEVKEEEKKEEEESDAKGDEYKGLDWFINRVQSCFFRQLSALRKHGPISDMFVTRENVANVFMLKMGYQSVKLTEHSPENTLWFCRYCGGGMGV